MGQRGLVRRLIERVEAGIALEIEGRRIRESPDPVQRPA